MKKMMKILLVDNNKIFRKELSSYIQSLQFHVSIEHAATMKEAYKRIKEEFIDLLIIEAVLCQEDDWIFLEKQRVSTVQIIYLTDIKEKKLVVKAMQTEPLAYLTKPFNKTELYAFLKLVDLKTSKAQEIFYLGAGYHFNTYHQKLYKNNKVIKLSIKERSLLKLLIAHQERTLSFEEIENLWDYPPKASTLRTMIYRLREKLEHKFIITVPNEGLKLEKER